MSDNALNRAADQFRGIEPSRLALMIRDNEREGADASRQNQHGLS